MRKNTCHIILVLALCAAMLTGVFAVAANAEGETREPMSAADIYEQNVGSTVGIRTTITTNIWGYETQSATAGSGFIISDNGYILTNYHVVKDAEDITVTTYGGDSYDAELVGYVDTDDIAVLKVDASGLVPVTIGDSGALRVGDEVVAIGNPLGELTFSLTGGMISALDREVTVSSGVTMDLIQTDCAINSGNSGGALFNMYGEVIGITNAKYSSRASSGNASIDNIGFAIPISRVIRLVESIMTNGTVAKPYIGVTVTSVSDEALAYGLPQGASVRSVTEDGPAAQAGLQENDIITAVDGEALDSFHDLTDIVLAAAPGDVLTLTVYRQGQTIEVDVEVGENVQPALPEEDPAPEETTTPQQPQQFSIDDFEDFEEFMRQFGGSDFLF